MPKKSYLASSIARNRCVCASRRQRRRSGRNNGPSSFHSRVLRRPEYAVYRSRRDIQFGWKIADVSGSQIRISRFLVAKSSCGQQNVLVYYRGYTGQLACIELQIRFQFDWNKAPSYFVMGMLGNFLFNGRLVVGVPEPF